VDYGNNQGTSQEDVAHKAQETASNLVSQAQEVASSQASNQMTRAADALESVARTLHESGSGVRDQQPQVAQVADRAAERIDQASQYLRERELSDLIADAESYARREPLLVLGAAFAAGFIAARFLKASSPNDRKRALVPYDRTSSPSYGIPSYGRPTNGGYSSDEYAEPTTARAYPG
jgi:ElaB/YqjD/DUF883 family membrane-anchored ribosome-binding protein